MIPRLDALLVGLVTHRAVVSCALVTVALAGAAASVLLKRAEDRAVRWANATHEEEA